MANIAPKLVGSLRGKVKVYLWETITETDTPLPLVSPGRADRSVQVLGTIGGGTFTLEGSDKPGASDAEHQVVKDFFGANLSATVLPFFSSIAEPTYSILPQLAGGAGVDIDVYLLVIQTAD